MVLWVYHINPWVRTSRRPHVHRTPSTVTPYPSAMVTEQKKDTIQFCIVLYCMISYKTSTILYACLCNCICIYDMHQYDIACMILCMILYYMILYVWFVYWMYEGCVLYMMLSCMILFINYDKIMYHMQCSKRSKGSSCSSPEICWLGRLKVWASDESHMENWGQMEK